MSSYWNWNWKQIILIEEKLKLTIWNRITIWIDFKTRNKVPQPNRIQSELWHDVFVNLCWDQYVIILASCQAYPWIPLKGAHGELRPWAYSEDLGPSTAASRPQGQSPWPGSQGKVKLKPWQTWKILAPQVQKVKIYNVFHSSTL